ncbi:T20M3.17 PROTEIN [Salix purpurea]|uniref:T20M3.17 PROTEIN n=1 Tax=Salix purpurea TaxID=77065 RepID=A0A9Q0ZNK3_SALPP|nr:T20M3.17 PROTEIN [Salix purpurea]
MSGNFIVAVLMSSALTRTLKAAARSSSFDGLKRVKSLFSKMKKTRFDQSEPESPRKISGPDGTERKSTVSKIGKMGPVCKARNKTAEVVIEFVEQEEIDLDEQIGKEICSNDHCMWLTSDSSSPTGFFDEYRLSSSLHVSVDEWMISWSSTLAKSDVHLDKASSISDKIKQARSLTNLETPNPEEDESSERTGPELEMRKTDFSVSSSDSPGSYFEHCCGNLTGFDDSAAFDSPSCSSRVSDLDRMSFSVSFLSLDVLTFLLPGKFKEGDLRRDLSPENSSSEAEVLKDSNTDGPLFWPFDKKLDWDSEEDWKCFAMSPRKDTPKLSISPRRVSSESAEMKFHDSRVDSKVVCRRRLLFSSGSAAPNIPEKKQTRDDNRSAKKMNSMQSRLKKSVRGGKGFYPQSGF